MKQQVSPAVVVIVIVVVVGLAAALIWKGTAAKGNEDINKIISAGVAKGGGPGSAPTAPPGVTPGRGIGGLPNMGNAGGGAPMASGLPGAPSPGAPMPGGPK